MSTQKIAQFMIERRSRSMPVLTSGEILGAVGSEGLQEALQRRWIVPSPETGLLQINTDLNRVQEMVDAAGTVESTASVAENASTGYALAHAARPPLMEIAAPGTGKPAPVLGNAPATPTTPTAPTAPTAAAAPRSSAGLNVGADVTIAEDGKTYTGKIAGRSADGRYRVSFGPAGKPATNREYTPDEMQIN